MNQQIPLDVDTWADDRIDIAGEWPEALCVADLRYWNAGYGEALGHKKPSIRAFSFCWSWKKDRAHRLIRRFDSNGRTVIGQQSDSDRTVDPDPTPNMTRQSDSNRTAIGQQSDGQPIAFFDDWKTAADLFADLFDGRRSPRRTSGPGRALNARIAEHGIDKVSDVLTWAARSDHERARFLRKQRIGLKTLMNPDKFLIYLAFCVESSDPALVEASWIEPDTTNRPQETEISLWS